MTLCVCARVHPCVRACMHACVCWEGGLEDILGHLQQTWEFFLVACWAEWVQGGSGGVGVWRSYADGLVNSHGIEWNGVKDGGGNGDGEGWG